MLQGGVLEIVPAITKENVSFIGDNNQRPCVLCRKTMEPLSAEQITGKKEREKEINATRLVKHTLYFLFPVNCLARHRMAVNDGCGLMNRG